MKRFFLLSFVLFLTFVTAVANPVGKDTAKEIGAKYLSASVGMKAAAGDLRLVKTYYMDNGEAAFYVFNANKGYVMVAAQDVATPILGYSDEGQFDANDIPENMQWWLKDYANQIQYGVEENKVDYEKTSKQWELVKTTGRLSESKDPVVVVAPLLGEIVWNQNCYYNDKCPVDESATVLCGHKYAGCVACSMSQIMRKWNYPTTGNGSFSYTPYGSPTQSVNFGATTYDWANMPVELTGTSTDAQIDAVATLMWHAGVAVKMLYNKNGSSAYSDEVPIALKNYFRYSDELSLETLTYNDDSVTLWKVKLRSSLNHGYPMYYSGVDGSSGHAFVCDGYDSDNNFHINWGYSGNKNGYYAIGALNYGGGAHYNAANDAVINIHPSTDPATVFPITVAANDGSLGTVSGGDNYSFGTTVTVTATATAAGYSFCYWSEDGVVVSTSSSYSFKAKYDRNLVAVFDMPYTITASANNNEYGSVTGGGEYTYAQECTLTATPTPNSNYIFLNWTNGEEIVSVNESYTFTVTGPATYVANFGTIDGTMIGSGSSTLSYCPTNTLYKYAYSEQIYTATEIGESGIIESVAFFNTTDAARTRNMTIYMKHTDKSSFASNTDWISVSGEDQVFNGSVTFAASGWTIIGLTSFFLYDGTSNLVLVVDDNTGSTTSTTNFKVFAAGSNKTIYCRQDADVDPSNPPTGFLANSKNQIVVKKAAVTSTFSVNATVYPENTGSLSGTGNAFAYGNNCTLTATPEEGYVFVSWTNAGNVVSTDASYSFNVKSNLDLVANFRSVNDIPFEDEKVKTICIDNWDLNKDGELSYSEAALVIDLGEAFRANDDITSFDELQFFTSLTSISANAFNHCDKLASVIMPDGVMTIENNAFYRCTKLAGIAIPDGVTSIGENAFEYCSLLPSIDLPNSVTTIGSSAFQSCTGLNGALTLPNNLTSLGNGAFSGCNNIEGTLIIPDGVTSISPNTFYNCSKISAVVIPNSVTNIAYSAFGNCTGLNSVTIDRVSPANVSAISFNKHDGLSIKVPFGKVDTYKNNTNWSTYSDYISAVENSYLFSSNGNWADGSFTSAAGTDAPNTASAIVFIDANCTIPENHGDVTIGTLVVSAGKALTVNSGNTLVVTKVDNAGDDSRLVINDGAQLIIPDGANVKATFKKSTEASTAKATNSWYAIFSPVDNVEIESFVKGTHNVYRYDETETEWEEYRDSHNIYTTLDNGRGYLYRSTTADFEFAGDVNTDNYTYPLTYTASAGDLKGFHLIGNPYSHNIYKGENAAITNTYLEDGFYTLTAAGAWVAGTDNTTAIAPNQAILVQAKSSANAVNLTITHTTNQGPTAAKNGNSQIMFAVDNDDYSDVAYVIFKEGHGLNKVEHRNAEIPMLYVKHNDERFAIADMDEGVKTINLGFAAKTIGKYTLSVKAEGDFNYLHLIDKLTGNDVDLLIENEYHFIGAQGDNDDRFVVCFDKSEMPDGYNDSVFAWQNGNDIIVNGDGELQIFDLAGRMATSIHVNDGQTISTSVLRNGVYIFKLVGNDVKTQKIIVR